MDFTSLFFKLRQKRESAVQYPNRKTPLDGEKSYSISITTRMANQAGMSPPKKPSIWGGKKSRLALKHRSVSAG